MAEGIRGRLGTFAERVATVAGGVALGQALLIAASPVVTRLYDPAAFGLLAAYMATIGMLGVLAAWRLPTAIALPSSERDALGLLGLSLGATALTTAAVSVAIALYSNSLASLAGVGDLDRVAWLVPPGVFALGSARALTTWLARRERYGTVGAAKAAEGATKAALQLALPLAGGGLGLLVADLAARVFALGVLATRAVNEGLAEMGAIPAAVYRSLAWRYRGFPLLGAPAALLNTAGLQAPALLLAAYYDLHIAGVYALGQRVVALPSALVGQAASQVFVADGGRLAREDPEALLRLFVVTTKRLAAIITLPMAALAVIAPWLFATVFGDTWIDAGRFVQVLAVTFGLQFVALPLSQTLSILERQRWQLVWDASRLVAVAGAIVLCGNARASADTAVVAIAIVSSVAYVALHALGYAAIRIRLRERTRMPTSSFGR